MLNRFFTSARVRPSTRTARRTAVMAMLASLLAPPAPAQQVPYPSKTTRLIASQAPGGGIDGVCRIVAPKLADSVGQTVIVDNRPGANGSLAAEITAKSPPDGYPGFPPSAR